MATLDVQRVILAGLTPSYDNAAVGGDEFVNSGRAFIHVKNGGGTSIDVTVDSQTSCNQGVDHDAVVPIPASEERMIGPFRQDRFNDTAGKVQIAYSGVTTVTIAVIEVP